RALEPVLDAPHPLPPPRSLSMLERLLLSPGSYLAKTLLAVGAARRDPTLSRLVRAYVRTPAARAACSPDRLVEDLLKLRLLADIGSDDARDGLRVERTYDAATRSLTLSTHRGPVSDGEPVDAANVV